MRHCFDTESIRRQSAEWRKESVYRQSQYQQQQHRQERERGHRGYHGQHGSKYNTLMEEGAVRWRQHHELPVEVIRMTVVRQWSKDCQPDRSDRHHRCSVFYSPGIRLLLSVHQQDREPSLACIMLHAMFRSSSTRVDRHCMSHQQQ
ncbi:hypothetical protein RP20_CCG014441 [Aedes albopictus]|nr:hypothetical protein RP20_CCG014441 [Aedes albopictus]